MLSLYNNCFFRNMTTTHLANVFCLKNLFIMLSVLTCVIKSQMLSFNYILFGILYEEGTLYWNMHASIYCKNLYKTGK
jgi:hypothetical protein